MVIPQIQEWFLLRDQEKITNEKITVLKQNLSFLSTLDDGNNNRQLQVASTALPSEKDFTSILSAISQAAANSGISVGDFSFQVGELSATKASNTNSTPEIDIILVINGGIDGTRQFLHELTNRLPLSEVTNVRVNDATTTITILFYYKPLPVLGMSDSKVIKTLSKNDIALLDLLSSFKQ